jgi:hypothetical protein
MKMTEYGYRYVILKEVYDNPDALAWYERDARRRLVDMVKGDVWFRLRARDDQPMKWVPWGNPDDPATQGLVPCSWEDADRVWMRWTLETKGDDD